MKLETCLRRVDAVSSLGVAALGGVEDGGAYGKFLPQDKFAEFRSAGLSLLSNVLGSKHPK